MEPLLAWRKITAGRTSKFSYCDDYASLQFVPLICIFSVVCSVNLLYPSGQFGTRRTGGKDHASARYIFTRLEKIARAIFHPDDDELLTYQNDDGLSIEPEYYMPVIPIVLANGCQGIGTGWSTFIPQHDPREIISNLRKLINNKEEEIEEMYPYVSGWTGEVRNHDTFYTTPYTINI